jgi:hypothetical protein
VRQSVQINRTRAKAELVKGRSCRRFFIDRALRIADSLQIGLNIEPKALRFPSRRFPPKLLKIHLVT